MEILRFKPGAEPGVVNFGLALPEVGLETALNTEVPELQFYVLRALREVAADILISDIQARQAVTSTLCFDYHGVPALQNRLEVDLRQKKQPRQFRYWSRCSLNGNAYLREPVRAKAVLLPQPGLTPIRSIDCECFGQPRCFAGTASTAHAHIEQRCVVGMNGLCTEEQFFSKNWAVFR